MNKTWLETQIENGCSTTEIATLSGKARTTVRYWLKKYGLKTRYEKGLGKKVSSPKKACIRCGEPLPNSNKDYCSQACFQRRRYENYISRWKRGQEDGVVGTNTSKYIRRYLFEKYNNKCAKCGWSEVNKKSGKIPLCMDHIDGNYKNNREENLILLCPNCHSLTPTYGALNYGNGRPTKVRR